MESDKKIEINFSDKSEPVNVNRTKFKISSTTKDEEHDEDDENVDCDKGDDEDDENEGVDENDRNEEDVRDEDDENDEDEGDVRVANEGGIGGKDVNELDAGGFDEDEEDETGANADDDNLDRCDLGERFSWLSLDDVSYAVKVNRRNDNSSRPKPKSALKYHLASGAENEAKLLSYQPKCTSTSKNWVNVVDIGSEHPYSINWHEVIWWEQIELEETLILTEQQEHEQAVIDAEEKELKNFIENKVFTWVEDEGQNAIYADVS